MPARMRDGSLMSPLMMNMRRGCAMRMIREGRFADLVDAIEVDVDDDELELLRECVVLDRGGHVKAARIQAVETVKGVYPYE